MGKKFLTHSEKRHLEKMMDWVNIPQLMDWIKTNKSKLNRLPKDKLSILKYDKRFGDEWDSEYYWGWTLKFSDGTHILVASVQHIVDAEDWGQAESYNSHTCCNMEDYHEIPAKEILNKLKNLIS
jgi:hypothetical protein